MPRDFGDEDLVRLLADSRNRTILTILQDAGPLTVDELAEQVVDHNTTVISTAEYENEYEQTRLSLHHRHLPELAEGGLIDYDRDENVVARRTRNADWLDIEQIDELLTRVQGHTSTDGEIGVIDGRDTLIEYGCSLANTADQELFCLYVSDDLLDESCITSERAALDRGVDMHIGSPDPDVREHCRTHLPEAIIWEPQYDWMTSASSYPKVGRLVFADREHLMLGLVEESEDDGTAPETAMIGEGEDNPLVVLTRELLGPRLDHLDFQSENFQEHLPD